MSEEWRDIPGFLGYKASDMGRIASCKKRLGGPGGWVIEDEIQRVLSPGISSGYKFVLLRSGKSTNNRRVHRLVMLTFVGECPDGLEVCHNNGKKNDCRLSNLRYDTHAANFLDAVEHGQVGGRPRRTASEHGQVGAPSDWRRK